MKTATCVAVLLFGGGYHPQQPVVDQRQCQEAVPIEEVATMLQAVEWRGQLLAQER